MIEKQILNCDEINQIINKFSKKIYEEIDDSHKFGIVGIQTRGIELGIRIRKNIEQLCGNPISYGILDISFYRDDLTTKGVLPVIKETRIEFNISKMTILLVDDVIFTGRTTKAALDTLTSFGRPRAIKLFSLIDRGNRELPIQPDYFGYRIKTKVTDKIKVRIKEVDNVEDSVLLYRNV